MKVLGFDPSLNNWGIARGNFDENTGEIHITDVALVQPEVTKSKQVRQNSKDLAAAEQLARGVIDNIRDAQAIFVEVPVGSQSARAMASYGICTGVLGYMRATGIPFFIVTPTEVKMVSVGNKSASKKQMIDWAITAHPNVQMPSYKKNGIVQITEAKAEHMADAIATIHAGVTLPDFQQFLRMTA